MKKQTLIVLSLLVLLAMTLAACGSTGSDADPLDGTAWTLYAYRKTSPIPGSTITAEFNDGQVRGSAGCNSYGGTYEVRGDVITFTDVFITEMACMDPEGVMEQEQEIMSFFWDAERFEFDGDWLLIWRSDGEALTFDLQ